MLAERSGRLAPVSAQAGVAVIATAVATSTSKGTGGAVGRAAIDHVQKPNQIKPLKCNKHVDLI